MILAKTYKGRDLLTLYFVYSYSYFILIYFYLFLFLCLSLGRDFPEMEDKMNWHGKALGAKSAEVIAHLKTKLISPTFEAEVKVIHYFKLMNIEYRV